MDRNAGNTQASDSVRSGLARLVSEYEQDGAVRFGDVVTVPRHHCSNLRRLADLLELDPRDLLDHSLHYGLKDMTDPDNDLLPAWTRLLHYTDKDPRRILPRFEAWQKKRRDAKPVEMVTIDIDLKKRLSPRQWQKLQKRATAAGRTPEEEASAMLAKSFSRKASKGKAVPR